MERDEQEAVRWFRTAAELDYAPALHRLGNCYLQGSGVDRDVAQAIRWYRKAAELNYQPSLEVLHKMEEGSGG